MALPQSTDVLEALDRAAHQLPELSVVDVAECDGYAWLVDPNTHTAYIRTAEPCEWSANLVDALDDLLTRCGVQDTPRPVLQLLQGGGEGDGHQPARTGS